VPELPEVETIARDLDRKTKGKTIKKVQVKVSKLIKIPNTKFVQALMGKKVKGVSRRAKVIKVNLGDIFLLIHLKLTGQLIYRNKSGRRSRATPRDKLTAGGHPVPRGLENLPNKFTHIIFTFTDGGHLFYNDLRKFGWMKIVKASEVDNLLNSEFGPEPLSPRFTQKEFQELLKKKGTSPIKRILLDQKNIAGIGNIYADEACFYAGVKPTRKAAKIGQKQVKKLYSGIRFVLKSSIKHRGTSTNNYVDANGRQGGHVRYLKVYGRKGQKCRRQGCSGIVKKIKFQSRGTHFCEECQK